MVEAARRAIRSSAIALALLALPAGAAERSHTARAEFVRQHPCPAANATRRACPGYVVDHVTPLCAGGADAPDNMQWQTTEDARVKDREERQLCSSRRK